MAASDQDIAALYQASDAVELARLVAEEGVSAEALLDEALRRAEEHANLNALVALFPDQAHDQLGALPRGRFRGVPFPLKDLHVAMAGVPLSNGSRAWADQVPTHDSFITERYRRAGLLLFGRTATPELGLTTTTESRLWGRTRNPWNLDFTAGGSSGGAAAAVAAGIVPIAHASDGGGSIRIPASCCGLFGLKPSRGLVSFAPEKGEGWGGLSTNHAVTRTVRDSAGLLDVVAGNAPGDPYAAPRPDHGFSARLERPPAPLRIAFTTEPFSDTETDPECVEALEQAVRLCDDLGHTLIEARPKIDASALALAARTILATHVAAALRTRAEELGRPITEDDVEPATWKNLRLAEHLTALDYLEAIETVHATGRVVGGFFEGVDVLMTPTMPAPPQPLGALALDHPEPRVYVENLKRTIGFTQLFNCSGGPAMSVPLAMSSDGLPIGIQFAADLGQDERLLRLARQLEQAAPWSERRPPAR